jgi:hypothetical protein
MTDDDNFSLLEALVLWFFVTIWIVLGIIGLAMWIAEVAAK